MEKKKKSTRKREGARRTRVMMKQKEEEALEQCHNKAKGIPKCEVKKLTIDDNKKSLYGKEKDYVNFNSLRSYKHTIYTINCNKLGLSSFDNKRF